MVEYHKNVVRFDTREPLEASYYGGDLPYVDKLLERLVYKRKSIKHMFVFIIERDNMETSYPMHTPLDNKTLAYIALATMDYASDGSDIEDDIHPTLDNDEEDGA